MRNLIITPLEFILSLTIGQALVIGSLLVFVYVAGKLSIFW